MLMFGRATFGAVKKGIVSAAGLAVCAATAQADAKVTYMASATVLARAQAHAEAVRVVLPTGRAEATAAAAAKPMASHNGAGQVTALAAATAAATAFYSGAGDAEAYAEIRAKAFRRVRMRMQPPAKSQAIGKAESVLYTYAYGKPALARAFALGTTYYVGRGSAVCTASAVATPQMFRGGAGTAVAAAAAEASATVLAAAYGEATATGLLAGDAAVRKDGVLLFECFGQLLAEARAELLTFRISQAQVLRATAMISAAASYNRAGRGLAKGVAVAIGEALQTKTAAAAEPATVTAVASGAARRDVYAGGAALVVRGAAVARAKLAAKGQGTARASGLAVHLNGVRFLFYGAALATAKAPSWASRRCVGRGYPAVVTATATGFNQINDLTRAPESRTVVVLSHDRTLLVEASARLVQVA